MALCLFVRAKIEDDTRGSFLFEQKTPSYTVWVVIIIVVNILVRIAASSK